MDFLVILLSLFENYGYIAVFTVLLICGFGVPIPEDVSLVAGGVIAGLGYADVHLMFLVCMAGVLIGDSAMFTIGRLFGEKVLAWRFVSKLLTPARYCAVQDKFARYGNRLMFIARFLPGLRSAIFLTAGMTRRVPFWRFLMLDGLAALISVPAWVYLGYFGASNREWLLTWIRRGQVGILIAIALIGLILLFGYIKRRRAAQSAKRDE
ncbi:DedA family protein [Chitinimonas sp. BJB300]|uniref:DedA family protein n=1 Tax=Chitinimonas sp. BJB300 TaxID=1559339 RepID=UPI000C12010A|nr:DedA family protein [Chitinimonas sp. BJB300]PHV10636.1 DedA family protein [Chitinimonas sp. BJB300]TSJ83799.1 DedA family protein [Chitinimonas sp. BJB300]